MAEDTKKCNRVVLIGNGFDLAHGLKTSYNDFIKDYWEKKAREIELQRKKDLRYLIMEAYNGFVQYVEHQRVLNNPGWSDIENMYYERLKECYRLYETEKYSLDNSNLSIHVLNKDFKNIRKKLIEYLGEEYKKWQREFNRESLDKNFKEDIYKILKKNDDIGDILYINFCYTDTLSEYLTPEKVKKEVISIHGKLSNEASVIFGYGDELNEEAMKILETKENAFLDYNKVVLGSVNGEYGKIYPFIEKSDFDVYILGHSCANSDRVLLHEIFTHENCKHIRYFYYENDEKRIGGAEDFVKLTDNIYRIFGENHSDFRRRLIPFNKSEKMPQRPKNDTRNEKDIKINEEAVAVANDEFKAILSAKVEDKALIINEGQELEIYGIKFVKVEGGTFWMGAQKDDSQQPNYDENALSDESPVHEVTLDDYWMAKYPVTRRQWESVMNYNPSLKYNYNNFPVTDVMWDECQEFVREFISKTYRTVRLPTEAEWEFAARGGNKSKGYHYSGSNSIDEVAWYDDNSSGKTHAVGGKKPNELGIYDMSGNVLEWCNDRYGQYEKGVRNNPTGPSFGSFCVVRGGGFLSGVNRCRISSRNFNSPKDHYKYLGFRLVLIDKTD